MATDDLLRTALTDLGVADQVTIQHVTHTANGGVEASLVIAGQDGPPVTISVPGSLSPDETGREMRGELRRALRLCPLCQRIGHVEKRRGKDGQHEECLVQCPECGEFVIATRTMRDLREAWERGDPTLDRQIAEARKAVTGRGSPG